MDLQFPGNNRTSASRQGGAGRNMRPEGPHNVIGGAHRQYDLCKDLSGTISEDGVPCGDFKIGDYYKVLYHRLYCYCLTFFSEDESV